MITENWVIIPVRIQDIVSYGIGSAKIDLDGSMTFTIPGSMFGKEVEKKVRNGAVEAFMLSPVPSAPREGDMEDNVAE